MHDDKTIHLSAHTDFSQGFLYGVYLELETLLDENAASHIAVGRSYNFTINGGIVMNDDELAAVGGNQSVTHVDWMIGSAEINVHGEHAEGGLEPIMLQGKWVSAQ